MKTMIAILFVLTAGQAMAQVTTVDVVKVKTEYEKEALFFYENNWKVFRERALELKFISGFELVKSAVDSSRTFDILLITRYADVASHSDAEKNFQSIIKEIGSGGARMLNSVTRKEFIVSAAGYVGESLCRKPD
jgi:hypothetical protein